ncbi:MAG TPA: hypothetical protein VE988_03240 [Gemmataceae bacterium]|nr:hypothetical protein [Gemmataceae bacterium]
MDAGTTFVLAREHKTIDDHLWVVVSDTKLFSDQVVIVNLTTATPEKDQTCIIEPQEHAWLRHRSCVSYFHAKVTTLTKLLECKDKGLIVLQDTLDAKVLARICACSGDSTTLPPDIADVMVAQRLIRLDA